jgi:hypothetical protein
MDMMQPSPATGLQAIHMDPDHPVPGMGDGFLLTELAAETVDALLAATGPGPGSPLLSVELRHLGGALAETAPGHGALASLDGEFALFAVGIPMDPEVASAIVDRVDALTSTLAPWTAGSYLNFAERPGAIEDAFDAETYRRLVDVKTRYDETNVFRANHQVEPAS